MLTSIRIDSIADRQNQIFKDKKLLNQKKTFQTHQLKGSTPKIFLKMLS